MIGKSHLHRFLVGISKVRQISRTHDVPFQDQARIWMVEWKGLTNRMDDHQKGRTYEQPNVFNTSETSGRKWGS